MYQQLIKVTPEMCKRWLSNPCPGQRPLKMAWAKELARRQLVPGLWVPIEGYAINTLGQPVNGQHRMMGQTLSGVTIEMYVMFDVVGGYELPIDGGHPRTAQSVLGWPTSRIAICRMLHQLIKGAVRDTQGAVAHDLVRDVYRRHSGDVDAVGPMCIHGGPLTAAAAAGVAFVRPLNAASVDTFVRQVRDGELLVRGSPAYVLREWASANRGRSKMNRYDHVMAGIRAAMAHVSGEAFVKMVTRPYDRDGITDRHIRAYHAASEERKRRGID